MYQDSDFRRLLDEGPGPEAYRTEVDIDHARLIHSPAFRRLQGKTQLFPGADSDFFRNRLTHSLEVSQIAESIAQKINHEHIAELQQPINPKIVAIAGLAHDLGHPPFGHNGEKALDHCMKQHGGFEGNAQTLRIVSVLEKKRHDHPTAVAVGVGDDGHDRRFGLNLTYRVLASLLKYDNEIPGTRSEDAPLSKGYYASNHLLVREIKRAVCNDPDVRGFKTIECQIMDVADDIAYSTYDIDDAFKGGFLAPLDVISASPEIIRRVSRRVSERLDRTVDEKTVVSCLYQLFARATFDFSRRPTGDVEYEAVASYEMSKNHARIGYMRTEFTSWLVSGFLDGVTFKFNSKCPALSTVRLDEKTEVLVEVLKVFSFEATIMSPRLKISESRGYDIVTEIFDRLSKTAGQHLLPDDFRDVYHRKRDDKGAQMRVICDFIAGMTDRYAVEFYGRLTGESHRSIFTPL